MNYKLTIEQADIKNVVKGLLETYQGSDLFTDFRAAVRDIIKDEFYRKIKSTKSAEVAKGLSVKYGISERYVYKCIYGY